MTVAVSARRLAILTACLSSIGPFAIDTYLPAFPAIGEALHASELQVQQTLTFYLATFAFMNLWHGALSDALGRRRVLLWAQGVFVIGCVGASMAGSIEQLWFWRAVQGAAGGAGMSVGRAVVRDVFSGADAQRLLGQAMMLFAIAPAVAPIVGGWVHFAFGWRGVFVFLALVGFALWWFTFRMLPETLPVSKRQNLKPGELLRAYRGFFGATPFWRLAGALATNFQGFFLYVLAAPAFLLQHLKVSPQAFAWLFIPSMLGTLAGGALSARLAGRVSLVATVRIGYGLMFAAAAYNLVLGALGTTTLPWAVLPFAVYTCGMGTAMSALQVMLLDLSPTRRGMVSSCHAFTQSVANAFTAGVIVPWVWHSTQAMAVAMFIYLSIGAVAFLLHRLAADRTAEA